MKIKEALVDLAEQISGESNLSAKDIADAILLVADKFPESSDAPGNATTTTSGLVKQGAAVADAAGDEPTAAEFKALLDSLRTAGIIATNG